MKKILLFMALALSPRPLQAQDALLEQVMAANFPSSLKADFTLIRHTPMLAEDLRSNGTVYMQAPDKLRWEVLSPTPQVSILHSGDAASRRFTLPSARDFEVENDAGGKILVLHLVPIRKDLRRVCSRIVLYVQPETLRIQEAMLIGVEDDYTRVTFANIQTNLELDPALFK